MLRAFGVQNVSILAGGLAEWQRDGYPLIEGEVSLPEGDFEVKFDDSLIKRLPEVLLASHEKTAQLVDARPAARFNAEADEPRPGLKRGHIPGALNVPWTDLVIKGQLKTTDELQEVFNRQGVNLTQPIIASCGSGVTAAVVMLALATLGVEEVKLYDGSWSEWGARNDLPIEPAQ
jgi:thiosulfate/3-mercaptopyruvate sulfurtransferase